MANKDSSAITDSIQLMWGVSLIRGVGPLAELFRGIGGIQTPIFLLTSAVGGCDRDFLCDKAIAAELRRG